MSKYIIFKLETSVGKDMLYKIVGSGSKQELIEKFHMGHFKNNGNIIITKQLELNFTSEE